MKRREILGWRERAIEVSQHLEEAAHLKEDAKDAVTVLSENLRHEQVLEKMEEIPVEELKKSDASRAVSVLKENGILNMRQLAEENNLMSFDGIGDVLSERLTAAVKTMEKELSPDVVLKISVDEDTGEIIGEKERQIVRNLYVIKNAESMQKKARKLYSDYYGTLISLINETEFARSLFKWIFTFPKRRRAASEDGDLMREIVLKESVHNILQDYTLFNDETERLYESDFLNHGADYYALLDSLSSLFKPVSFTGDLSESLRQKIENTVLDLTGLRASLRGYQTFGVKYMVHQGKTLLADEMGLGKTVEVLGLFIHERNVKEGTFHALCAAPAGLLSNWAREISDKTDLNSYFLKDQKEWKSLGGVLLVSYDSLEHVSLDGILLDVLAADETHYVKNPRAQRTQNLFKLSEQAMKIVLMSGTPMENHVEEMVFLISRLNTKLAEELEKYAWLSKAPAFRRKASVVYLRRTREEVLKELPQLEVEDCWLLMSEEDEMIYRTSVEEKDQTAMRRVGWIAEDGVKKERMLDLCMMAALQKRKAVVFSFYLDTLRIAEAALGSDCVGMLYGGLSMEERNQLVNQFEQAKDGAVLLAQIGTGGQGLNLQCASIIILAEPQLKPTTEAQAISRAFRMGQVRNVLAYRLLCADTKDEEISMLLDKKEILFDAFADPSTKLD